MATTKTNAVRLLERLGVPFELREYEVDPDDLAAETVARKVGLPPEQVFKTLVVKGDKHGVCLAVVPGDCELDLKALAKATGDKKIDTVALKDVEPDRPERACVLHHGRRGAEWAKARGLCRSVGPITSSPHPQTCLYRRLSRRNRSSNRHPP